jgi:GMP synthase PP-ATPase subunit
VVKMGDFEFDIDLLISMVEARSVLWDMTYDILKTETKRKRYGEKFVFVFKKTFKL